MPSSQEAAWNPGLKNLLQHAVIQSAMGCGSVSGYQILHQQGRLAAFFIERIPIYLGDGYLFAGKKGVRLILRGAFLRNAAFIDYKSAFSLFMYISMVLSTARFLDALSFLLISSSPVSPCPCKMSIIPISVKIESPSL